MVLLIFQACVQLRQGGHFGKTWCSHSMCWVLICHRLVLLVIVLALFMLYIIFFLISIKWGYWLPPCSGHKLDSLFSKTDIKTHCTVDFLLRYVLLSYHQDIFWCGFSVLAVVLKHVCFRLFFILSSYLLKIEDIMAIKEFSTTLCLKIGALHFFFLQLDDCFCMDLWHKYSNVISSCLCHNCRSSDYR